MKRLFYLNIILFLSLFVSCQSPQSGYLIEAESFEDPGSWVIDPQFVEQMGSPYLLAHGMGIPVENAISSFQIKESSRYYVFARTMNWAKGDWEAPGQFNISIDEKVLQETLGNGEENWHWQYAGEMDLSKGKHKIELIDLTGFEGRCDAIYLSKEKKAPANEMEELKNWRSGFEVYQDKIQKKRYDLVICGGGIAGCAAAIAAAESGLEVAIIHDRPILGGNASSEIRVHTEGIPWKSKRILSMIDTKHWPNGSPDAKNDDTKRHENISKYENIHLFLNYRAFNTLSRNNRIDAVLARHTSSGEIIQLKAPVFADCTGDGWIGYWSGADYMYGRENFSVYDEKLGEHGELWSPEKADQRVMGSSVLWRSMKSDKSEVFPAVPWAMDVAKEYAALNGTWKWEYSHPELHQIHDAEKIRDHMFKAIYGSFFNAKQYPKNDSLKLEWVSFLVGKRESRRLVGDYIYSFKDVKDMRYFEDAVVMERRSVDVHYQQILKDSSRPDFLSEALFYPVEKYFIPYRCLYSKDIDNLFMAGRCFSCSHIGLGGPRVMYTTGQMGVAVGYASALCVKKNALPRDIYNQYIKELQRMIYQSDHQ